MNSQLTYLLAQAYETAAMKIPTSRGRSIELDAKGKPRAKKGYASTSATIAKRKAANTPRLTKRVKGASGC